MPSPWDEERIEKEIDLLVSDPANGKDFTLITTDHEQVINTGNLVVIVEGPTGSPYEGGRFELRVQFPQGYPHTPIMMQMITPIYHPLIYFPWKFPDAGGQRAPLLYQVTQPGQMTIVNSDDATNFAQHWKINVTLVELLRHLKEMLLRPGQQAVVTTVLKRACHFPGYNEWTAPGVKELHLERARATTQFQFGRWSPNRHKSCFSAFRKDVVVLLLVTNRISGRSFLANGLKRNAGKQRLLKEENPHVCVALPMELVHEIIQALWKLHHAIPLDVRVASLPGPSYMRPLPKW